MQENKQKTRWNNNQTLCICTSKQTKQVNSTNCVRNYSCKTEKTGNEFWQIKKYANARKREKEICDLWQKKEANTQTKKKDRKSSFHSVLFCGLHLLFTPPWRDCVAAFDRCALAYLFRNVIWSAARAPPTRSPSVKLCVRVFSLPH